MSYIDKSTLPVKGAQLAILIGAFIPLFLGSTAFSQSSDPDSAEEIVFFSLPGDMGGHTPRGFQGQGAGIFVGDNLNPGFPNGDGVQAFISFDISELTGTEVETATLSSSFLRINGNPFTDLGPITLEQVTFERFSSALWNVPVNADMGCVLSISPDLTSAGCDLSEAVKNAVTNGLEFLQFRLRFETVSDSDRQPDLALFFKQNSNANEAGVFELAVR